MSHLVTCHVSSLAIPVPVFTLAVCYLVFAYIHIYRDRPHQPPDKLTTVTFSRYLPPSFIVSVKSSKEKRPESEHMEGLKLKLPRLP